MMFDSIVKRISNGELVPQIDLLPYLSYEGIRERGEINYRLAEAFSKIGNYKQAKVFIERAWILSRFSDEVLGLYKHICENNQDIESLRDAYKRQGMRFASEGDIGKALGSFNKWQYALATHYHLDRYSYDIDILECIERLAQPFQFTHRQPPKPLTGRKIRLAYLVYGAPHKNSVLVKINQMFAKHHNKDLFEVAFFIPEKVSMLRGNYKQIQDHKKDFLSCNVAVFFAQKNGAEARLISCGQQIYDFQPDILITSAALADLEHYFIASLKPAPLIIGLLQGPPQQFVAPSLDHAISWSRHPLIDSPTNTSLVRLGVKLPDITSVPHTTRTEFNIPDDAVVLMSAGRYVKFQHRDFWRNLIKIMSEHPNSYFVVVGAERNQITCLSEFDINHIENRMRFLGWRTDCVSLLTIADILIDTYPSGGGHVLIDAMALGVPFVSFANNYMKAYDQTDWSVAEDFVEISELILPRGDFDKFSTTVGKLILDEEYRNQMSARCLHEIHSSLPTPEEGVIALEEEYIRLIDLNHKKPLLKKRLFTTGVKHHSYGIKGLIKLLKNISNIF